MIWFSHPGCGALWSFTHYTLYLGSFDIVYSLYFKLMWKLDATNISNEWFSSHTQAAEHFDEYLNEYSNECFNEYCMNKYSNENQMNDLVLTPRLRSTLMNT